MPPIESLIGQPSGRIGPNTQAAIDLMKAGKPGDKIDVNTMSNAIGRDCSQHGRGYANVCTAIRNVEANYNLVWRWKRELGAWLCLAASDRVDVVSNGLHTCRRRIVRTTRIALGTDQKSLAPNQRTELNTATAVAGLLAMASGGTFRKLVGEVAERASQKLEPPPTAKLLALMTEARATNGSEK